MNDKPVETNTELTQTAVHCYLSTILSTAECFAKLCPELGVPYRNRWRRLPQRIGFDMSVRSLQASGHMFQSDLDRFAELAVRYFGEGLHLVEKIGSEGVETFEGAVREASFCAELLTDLAASLDEAADLDSGSEVSDMLSLQSAGVRKSARQLKTRLLPSLQSLASLVRDCRRVMAQVEQESIMDASTGFVNTRGFRYELKARYDESRYCCVVLIDCTTTFETGVHCSDEEFKTIAGSIAARLSEQFRPWDCVGRVAARRFAIIFEGSDATARDRSDQIARSISGAYPGGISVAAAIKVMEAMDSESLLNVIAAVEKGSTVLPNLIPPSSAEISPAALAS